MLNKQEFWALNWLRFFLSIYIVLYHTLNAAYEMEITHPVISAFLSLGNFATTIFFVLSGFLLTYVYVVLRHGGNIDTRSFLVSRLATLYPIHLFTIALALPVFYVVIHRHGGIEVPLDVYGAGSRVLGSSETILAALMNVTLIQAWNPLYLILNPPSWSLSTLLFFYIFFPYIAPRLYRSRRPVTALVLFGILFLLPGAYAQWAGLDDLITMGVLHRNPIIRLPLFLGGILLCVLYARRIATKDEHLGFAAIACICIVVMITVGIAAYCKIAYPKNPLFIVRNGLYYPAALMIVWLCAHAGPVASKWNQRWSSRLGKVSLSIFALHFPLFDIFRRAEKLVRAYLDTYGQHKSLSSLIDMTTTMEGSLALYPVYFFFVVVAAIAMQEKIVNPTQVIIKKHYATWKTQHAPASA